MSRWLLALAWLALVLPLRADQKPPEKAPPKPAPAAQKEAAPAEGAHAVQGLSLPADQTVSPDEGFTLIQATTTGRVRFAVLSQAAGKPVKFIETGQNGIVVSIPPAGGTIQVFAVALLPDGSLSEFARCTLTVQGTSPPTPSPWPGPGPAPAPLPAGTKLWVRIIEDPTQRTPATAALLNSLTLRQALEAAGHTYRVYDVRSPVLQQKGLSAYVQQAGGVPCVIVQTAATGEVKAAARLPATEAEVLALVRGVAP